MPPNLDWGQLMKVDPDALSGQERLADKLLLSLSKVESNDLKESDHDKLVQLFRITQALMKMKAQEVDLAVEEVEKAGEEQATIESQLKAKVNKLENELEMAQMSVGGRDTRFLRDEIRQLENQLERKEKELAEMEKQINKEKKANENLTLRAEEAENENSKLRREIKQLKKKNDQLRQDIIDYQRQIDSQRETLLSRRGGDSDFRSQLSKKNLELVQYLDEIQNLTEANEKLEVQNHEMQKNLEESVNEMEKMTDEYNKMKVVVQQTDIFMDQLSKEKEHLRLQVQELTEQIQARTEEDDPVMAAVNAKVEEWKSVLSAKDDEIIEYQQMLRDLKVKLKTAQLDSDKNNVMALQQAVQERDSQIKMLTDQVEQYTSEMERNALVIEDLKKQLQKDTGLPSLTQQNRIGEIQTKLQVTEKRALEAERVADLAESDARDKDKELSEALARMRAYEAGEYGLENAVAEIKECKTQIRIRDHEVEALTKEINTLEMKINDLLDENEDFRERLGLNPKEVVDLTEFRRTKALKQQQYRAENQILLKEIERLEEERLELKKHIRRLAKDKGKRAAALGLTADDLQLVDDFTENLKSSEKLNQIPYTDSHEQIKHMNEHLLKELHDKEKELELKRTELAQLKSKSKNTMEENKQLEQGMKEILQAIKDTQKDSKGETGLSIPILERLVNAIETKSSEGVFDANVHLKAQVDQLTGRNDELRKGMKEARKEAASAANQLEKANEKADRMENEIQMLRQSGGSSIVFKILNLPDKMAPSSAEVINSLNEYTVELLQELHNKEESMMKLEEALEEYKRKFAVIRHQQGLLYKEYQSERELWQKDTEKIQELQDKLGEQKEQDAAKIQEYNRWLDVLQKDPDEIKKQLAEAARKMTVLRVNEKSLTRHYTTLLEMEQHLRKENNKLKNEMIAMEAAVAERVGYLQRYKDMAAFKIAALQKALNDSVPSADLEKANKQYNDLTTKYRDMLQKDNLLVQKTTNLEHLEGESAVLRGQIDALNKELEITKEKLHTLEQAWEQITKLGGESAMDKATKAITNGEIVSISKKITTLEMKELNERQRAEHAHKMYEHLRSSFKQVEERNFELETKFAELTKQNLEAQRIEQELRDELANSVSKAVSDADRRRIMELEKTEADLKIEVSKLRDVSDVAKMQTSALEARQQSREKEVEALRKLVLDYQAQSDEKALIAKFHQHIIALQVSEATAVSKLEATVTKLQKLEAYNLRMEQKMDAKEQSLYYARQEGRNRAKHLRQTVQSLRRQFSGALPLSQQEKFSKTMIQLQNDKLKVLQEVQQAQQESRKAEDKALELEIRLKGLEELISTLKDVRGAQKVNEWHKKMEELRLQDLKQNRELGVQKEEIKYLKTIIAEQERTISSLQEEVVQQNNLYEEQQLSWDQREVDLERQLDLYERQHNDVLSTARKFEEATGSIPDPSLPVPQQLDLALRKIREHIRTILETQTTCKTLDEKLKEKEAALWKAEQNVLSRDRVINELRLRLPATAEREKLIAELGRREEDPEFQQALKVAHQTIANLQARLNQKEDVLKKYQHLQAKARQDQEEVAKKHEEELRLLHQKLDLHSDTSLNKFKQTALELMKKPSIAVPTTKHLARLAEMEQTVAEQDNSLSNITDKLKRVTAELEKQKQITVLKMKEHANEKAKLEERHVAEVKKLKENVAELRTLLSQMEKEVHYLRTELEAQKEANTRAPTTTMKSLVERLKAQLALKEKQQKALSKALLELRSEMTAHAEYQIVASASQKEENLNVQQIVDKHTKELKFRIEDLNEQLLTAKENLKASKNKENSLKEEMDSLNRDLNRSYKAHKKLQSEKEELDKENEELKKRIKRLASSMQIKSDNESKQSTVDELQKKIKRLETELERKATSERKIIKEDKTSKEEIVRWEEGKKWQARTEGMRNKLKEKEKEVESLTKQLSTIKDLYTRLEQEKASLQKKIKARGVTVDQVVGVRTLESEKEIEELKRRNSELENHIVTIKKQQALPRDSAMEDLNLKNRYLEEKLLALERQLSKDTHSRPSCNSIFPDCAITNTSEKIADFKSGKVNIKSYESEDKSKNVGNINWDGVIFSEEVESALKVEKEDQSTTVALDSKLETEVAENRDRFAAAEDNKAESETDRVSPSKTEEIPICEEQPEAVESNPQEVDPFGDIGGKIGSPFGKDLNRNPSNASEHAVTSTSENGEGDNRLTNEQSGNNTEDTNKAQQQDEKEEPAAPLVNEEEEKLSNEHSGSHAKESVDAVDETQENSEKEEPTEDDIIERLELKPDDVNETSGMGSDSHSQKDDEIQRENLKLSSENMELRFQLEQASKDLPRFKDKVADLKEMCDLLKKEKTEIEKKLGNVRGSGRSGKTVPELEKTIGLMKKVVERVQRENEELKKAPGVVSKEKLAGLERENEKLKSEFEKLKLQMGGQLSMRYESKTKGMEKIVAENERLRKELKKEAESAEKLKIAKNNLEIMNEKLMVQLEETSKRLSFAESRGPQLEGAESKSWKSIVVTRMYESKMKELETDIDKKNKSLSDLKQLLREATEREQQTEHCISDLKEQVELLKHFPEEAKTEPGLIRELQLIRLTNDRLEKEKTELVHQLQVYRQQIGATTEGAAEPGYDELLEKCIKHDKMMGDLVELQTQVKAADLDKRHLQEEVKKMKKELENFDPTFFEEIEDLKYNYNQEVKRNILLEEQLKKLSDQFGVQVNIPANVSID
ncbi:centrosomal protein of 290 kDa isoform X2 [Acipenser ruthenus]|uniref:centrosomal protein of 290 kDa isoform X2 n=1 Tax=Acipenser ruthenus TaxID=7906 RepID=UPI0027417DE9|nr:centrosomal protein of 290 kDa isoform X2 [Acipenser ruthenus]